jgi:hypothetical protein
MVAIGRDGGIWQRVSRKERCPVCGHDSWCGMIVGQVVACMRVADGAYASKPGKDNQIRHYHSWPDRAAPIPIRPAPERPVDWAAPAATTCRALYTAIAARYAGRPHSKACAAEAARRFGDRALDALAAADYCEIDERDLLAWLAAEGRVADAKSAGILAGDGKLAPALKARKVYAFRLPDGTVANLRGRDLTGRSPLKVLDLAGGYEERGADAGLYHAERVADVADGAGWLHLAGGCEKADALIAAGFAAVSTPGEGTLFDAALADLTARRVLSVAVWVDAEDPKEGEELSAGRRLGLAVAERLAATGVSVRVVEPAREPGSPKRDADGILRDGGPGALWDCWAASEDLAAFRARVGATPPDGPDGPLVAELRAQLQSARDKAAGAIRLLRATRKVLANEDLKQEGRAALGLAFELWERRDRPDTERLRNHADGENFYRYYPEDAGKKVAMSPGAISKAKSRLQSWGLLKSVAPAVCHTDPETGEEQWTRESYLHFDAESIPAWLEQVGGFKPSVEQCERVEKRRWGGPRWRCAEHPDATIEYTTTARCTQCGKSSEPMVECVDRLGEVVDAPPGWPENRIPLGNLHLEPTIDTDSDGCWLPPTSEDTSTEAAAGSEGGADGGTERGVRAGLGAGSPGCVGVDAGDRRVGEGVCPGLRRPVGDAAPGVVLPGVRDDLPGAADDAAGRADTPADAVPVVRGARPTGVPAPPADPCEVERREGAGGDPPGGLRAGRPPVQVVRDDGEPVRGSHHPPGSGRAEHAEQPPDAVQSLQQQQGRGLEALTVRCLSAGRGCPNRVPPHLDYCPDCEADGWHNHRAER